MPTSPDRLTIRLTPDQWTFLVSVLDAITITGKQAALVVSIQQAFADAREAPQPCADALGSAH
jgi:hypothetical protein